MEGGRQHTYTYTIHITLNQTCVVSASVAKVALTDDWRDSKPNIFLDIYQFHDFERKRKIISIKCIHAKSSKPWYHSPPAPQQMYTILTLSVKCEIENE